MGPRNSQGGMLVLRSELFLSSDFTLAYSGKYLSGGMSISGYARDADQNSRASRAPDRPPELPAALALATPRHSNDRPGPGETDTIKAVTNTNDPSRPNP